MKLHLTQPTGQNVITGYGRGYVSVNAARYEMHLLITADTVSEWQIRDFEALDLARFESLIAARPEIIILGTGEAARFPRRECARLAAEAGIGLEAMDSRAACRTYNILTAEGRNVLAAILVP